MRARTANASTRRRWTAGRGVWRRETDAGTKAIAAMRCSLEAGGDNPHGLRTCVREKSQHERTFDVNPSASNRCLPWNESHATVAIERQFVLEGGAVAPDLTARQQGILDVIEKQLRQRGYPPSVREIGEAVGLSSTSTVHSHLQTLEELGYLRRDPTKPRAIEVRYDPSSGAAADRRPVRHVPLVGDVAAGTDVLAQENIEELLPIPADFTGERQ